MTDLPDGWVPSTVGEICEKPQYGYTTKAASTGTVRFLRTTDLTHGPLDWTSVPYCFENPSAITKYLVQPGDLFVSRAGSVGVSVLVNDVQDKAVFASYLIRLRCGDRVTAPYLSHYLTSPGYWSQVAEMSAGIALQNINAKKLQTLTLSLPPLDEQNEIVRILDTQLARLDTVMGAVQGVRDKAEQFRRSLLHAAFTGQLTQPDPMRDTLPESWRWVELVEVTENHDGRRVPIKASDRENMQGEFPYYGASGVIDYVDDFIFDGCFLLVSEDGANLLARTKPIAFEASGRFWVNNHAHVLSAKTGTSQSYLMYGIEQTDLSGLVTGTAQPKLTQRNLNQMRIPIPTLDEQGTVVRALDTHLSRIENLLSVTDRVETECGRLRRSLLQAAFSGELTRKWREANG